MNLKELAKKLDYECIGDLYIKYGLTASGVSHLKRRNIQGYNDLMNRIILSHSSIGTDELVKMVDLYQLQQRKI